MSDDHDHPDTDLTDPHGEAEALRREIARLTDAADNHNAAWVAACDRIAALEAERDALNEELREARMQAIADGVQFQMDMEDLTAERDEALVRAERSERAERAAHDAANTAIRQRDEACAQVAMAYEVAAYWIEAVPQSLPNRQEYARHIRALTPADATAALARRDAAMRNEGRKSVKVKPLVWKEATGDDYRKGECFYARSIIDLTPISVTNSRNGWWLNTNSATYPTIEAAKAAAQADYAARILAALEPEGGE